MENRLYNSNNRAVIDEFGDVRQVTNCYPFGGVFSTTAYNSGDDLQPYKYNGKELDRTHGLDWYDYGARNYDATLPMWDRIDPLCEKYYHISPYAYCGNNPIIFVDPDGRRRKPTNDFYKGVKVRVSHNYGQRRSHVHKGVDINFGAGAFDRGAPVYATHSGRVTVKSYKDGQAAGNRIWITIKCIDGTVISTGYFHLDKFTVQNGAWVNEGEQIGTIGNSAKGVEHSDTEEGFNTHNHYEVKVNGKNINPSEEDKSDLIDTQELVKEHNSFPEIIVTPDQTQNQQMDSQENEPIRDNPQI